MKVSKTYDMPASKVPYKFKVDIDISDPVPPAVTDTTTVTGVVPIDVVIPPPPPPPPPPPSRKNLILESLFDKSDALSKWTNSQHCCVYSVNPSTDFARTGSKSLRFELHKTDGDIAGSKRAEINLKNEAYGVERWWGFSVMFPAGYKADPNCPEIIWQLHHDSGTGSPPLSLWSYGDTLKLNRRDNVKNLDNPILIGAITPGKWMDIVIHAKLLSTKDAITEVWINGVKQNIPVGIPNNYAVDKGGNCYLKMGIYKWGWKQGYTSTVDTRILYLADIRIGNELATYNDVAP